MSMGATEVFQAVESVFDSMLGLELNPANGSDGSLGSGSRLTSTIGLAGDWNGTVMLQCSGEMACLLASALLQMECPEVDDDVKDVLGEISNMVAGNISRLAPGQVSLGLPVVVEGSDYSMEVLRGQEILNQGILCEGKVFNVSIVEKS